MKIFLLFVHFATFGSKKKSKVSDSADSECIDSNFSKKIRKRHKTDSEYESQLWIEWINENLTKQNN